MNSTYLITKYDYLTGKQKVLQVFTSKSNAVNEIYSLATEFIKTQDGETLNHPLFTKCQEDLVNKPVGHYILADSKDHVGKYTIIKKYIETRIKSTYYGLPISQSCEVDLYTKLFDLDLVELPYIIFKDLYNLYRRQCALDQVDKIEPVSCKKEAETLWGGFTFNFRKTQTFNGLSEGKTLGELKTENPEEFQYYVKPSIDPNDPNNPNKSRQNYGQRAQDPPMFMSMMEEIVFDEPEKSFSEYVLDIAGVKELQRRLAHEALEGLTKLRHAS